MIFFLYSFLLYLYIYIFFRILLIIFFDIFFDIFVWYIFWHLFSDIFFDIFFDSDIFFDIFFLRYFPGRWGPALRIPLGNSPGEVRHYILRLRFPRVRSDITRYNLEFPIEVRRHILLFVASKIQLAKMMAKMAKMTAKKRRRKRRRRRRRKIILIKSKNPLLIGGKLNFENYKKK